MPAGRAGGAEYPFVFDARQHVRKNAVAVFALEFRVEFRCPAGKNDGADFDFNNLFFLIEIYRMRAACFFADPAFSFLQIEALLGIDDGDCRHRLGKRDTYGLGKTQSLIVGIGNFCRAFRHADTAARACAFVTYRGRLSTFTVSSGALPFMPITSPLVMICM